MKLLAILALLVLTGCGSASTPAPKDGARQGVELDLPPAPPTYDYLKVGK